MPVTASVYLLFLESAFISLHCRLKIFSAVIAYRAGVALGESIGVALFKVAAHLAHESLLFGSGGSWNILKLLGAMLAKLAGISFRELMAFIEESAHLASPAFGLIGSGSLLVLMCS